MAGQGKVDWDQPEAWKRLIAAMLATGVKLDLRQTAIYYGTTYDTLENRLRAIKKESNVMKEEVASGKRGEVTPARGTPKKDTTKKGALGLEGISNGRITKTPTKTKKNSNVKQEIFENSRIDFFAEDQTAGFEHQFDLQRLEVPGQSFEVGNVFDYGGDMGQDGSFGL